MRIAAILASARALRLCLFVSTLSLGLHSTLSATAGDRTPGTQVVLPDGVFYHNGGVVIDVTQPPFNAAGDGVTDDTAALIAALDVIADAVRIANADPTKTYPVPDESYIIYLPEGEYLVSDTIVYSGDPIIWTTNVQVGDLGGINSLRIMGESRENTKIRLVDNASGFGTGQQKAVLDLDPVGFNNIQTDNLVANLTINTGSNNPGAIGLEHSGANMSSMRNLTIQSGDGQGVAGIAIFTCPTLGYHSDITVEGFDVGIWMYPYHITHNSFEYVTLTGQNSVAILLDDSTTSLRKVLVEDCAGPAIMQREEGSMVVAIDCEFEAVTGGTTEPAIDIQNGIFAGWNITQTGFSSGVEVDGVVKVSGNIDAFAEPAELYYPEEAEGIILPYPEITVEDEPGINYPANASSWALVDDFLDPSDTDDSNALQLALNSGKSHIGFPKNRIYHVSGTINIPATTKVINGFFGKIKDDDGGILFKVNANSTDPLIIENITLNDASPAILHAKQRTLCLRMTGGKSLLYNNNTQNSKKLFVTNVTNFGNGNNKIINQQVWARSINNETPNGPCYQINNTEMWVFGYKTEKQESSFYANTGSFLEVMGGISNQYSQVDYGDSYSTNPMLLLEDSRATIVCGTNGPGTTAEFGFETLLDISLEDNQWIYDITQAPLRVGRAGQYFVPLSIVSDYDDFADKLYLGDINYGVGATDNRTGTGYIMWSEESVHTRFSAASPHTSNSDHLIAVVWDGTNWKYDNNTTLVTFTPVSSDVLIAEVDFTNDTVDSMKGNTGVTNGIDSGYLAGDLSFEAEIWNGATNVGEFTVSGTYFYTVD